MDEEQTKCTHLYESVISKRQDFLKRYLADGKYTLNTLQQDVVDIFCRYCGDSKKINENFAKIDCKD